jgi:hypothetical protein
MLRLLVIPAVIIALAPSEALAQRVKRLKVQIQSTPSGAAIDLDGVRQSKTTPAWLTVPRGDHKLRLELAGHAPLEEPISVTRAGKRLSFTLTAVGGLELRAGDDSATGATVTIDGAEAGTIPFTGVLLPGNHRVVIRREGYHDAERQVATLGGQTYAADITLQALPPPQGEILVAADVSGAQVLLDGTAAGTTPTILETAPGAHVIEIRAEGVQPHTETVTVASGGRVTVNAQLQPVRRPGGNLLVLTQPEGAMVLVDGQERGNSPATIEDVPAGTHIVEARRRGYEGESQSVQVEEGRQATVRVVLTEAARGGLRVTSSIPGAEVLLDGQSIGTTPLSHGEIEAGEHTVVVRSQGHRDWERRVTVRPAVELLVEATPDGFGRLNATADVEGAEVVIDGTVVGPAPLQNHELATGDHTVEIRAAGHRTYTSTITVEANGTNTIAAQLAGPAAAPAGPLAPEARSDRTGPRYTRAGFPPPPGSVAIDAAWGWPYLVGAYRLGIGIWDGAQWARLGVGLEVRSSVWVTEVDVRLAFGTRFARVMRIGAELAVGGSFGPDYETTNEIRTGFILNFTLTEAISLRQVAFGLHQRLEFWADTHGQVGNTGLVHDVNARVFVGGFVEVPVHRLINVWVQADYAPVQPGRRIMCANAWDATAGDCSSPNRWTRDVNLNVQAGIGIRLR